MSGLPELSHEARTYRPANLRDPGDAMLVQTSIDYGMDRGAAELWTHLERGSYGYRFQRRCAYLFYCDTIMAGRGDKAARDRVETNRQVWHEVGIRMREQAERDAEEALRA